MLLGLMAMLFVWLIYGLWKMLFDVPAPKRRVTDAELKALLNLKDEKARRKWLRSGGYKNL